MGYWEDAVRECINSQIHLSSCDNDGYCNFCGFQESIEEFENLVEDR